MTVFHSVFLNNCFTPLCELLLSWGIPDHCLVEITLTAATFKHPFFANFLAIEVIFPRHIITRSQELRLLLKGVECWWHFCFFFGLVYKGKLVGTHRQMWKFLWRVNIEIKSPWLRFKFSLGFWESWITAWFIERIHNLIVAVLNDFTNLLLNLLFLLKALLILHYTEFAQWIQSGWGNNFQRSNTLTRINLTHNFERTDSH